MSSQDTPLRGSFLADFARKGSNVGDVGNIDEAMMQKSMNTTLKEVVDAAKTLTQEIDKVGPSHAHIQQIIAMTIEAIQIASKNISDQDKGVDYFQALQSIGKLKSIISLYLVDPKDENFNKISDLCGHIIDRISQKILASEGRNDLNSFYKIIVNEQKKLFNVLENLHKAALGLNAFSLKQSEAALHFEFSSELLKINRSAKTWLAISITFSAVLLTYLLCSFSSWKAFLGSLTIPSNGSNVFLILASAPKIISTFLLLIISISSWKMFQSYKHLAINLKRKESAAKIMPTLLLGVDSKSQVEIKQAFLKSILEQEDTGFMAEVRSNQLPLDKLKS